MNYWNNSKKDLTIFYLIPDFLTWRPPKFALLLESFGFFLVGFSAFLLKTSLE